MPPFITASCSLGQRPPRHGRQILLVLSQLTAIWLKVCLENRSGAYKQPWLGCCFSEGEWLEQGRPCSEIKSADHHYKWENKMYETGGGDHNVVMKGFNRPTRVWIPLWAVSQSNPTLSQLQPQREAIVKTTREGHLVKISGHKSTTEDCAQLLWVHSFALIPGAAPLS